jgi:thymidylate kinase
MSVALVGPDGVGKSTIARRLTDRLGDGRYLYMGVNLETSSVVLPSTRLLLAAKKRRGGRPDLVGWPSSTTKKGWKTSLRAWVRIGNLMAEEWFRAGISWYHRLRGRTVVMDRHFLADYWKHDMDPANPDRPLISRIHGALLRNLYPRPDLVILLDLEPAESYRRKPEGSLEDREARYAEYTQLGDLFDALAVVDASAQPDDVLEACITAVERFRSGTS